MKFRTLVAIAAAAAASAVAWKMVKDARREDDDITLELAGDGAPDAQEAEEAEESSEAEEAQEVQEAQEAQEKEAAAETAAPAAAHRPHHHRQRRGFLRRLGGYRLQELSAKAATGRAGNGKERQARDCPQGGPGPVFFCRLFPWGGGRAAGKQR